MDVLLVPIAYCPSLTVPSQPYPFLLHSTPASPCSSDPIAPLFVELLRVRHACKVGKQGMSYIKTQLRGLRLKVRSQPFTTTPIKPSSGISMSSSVGAFETSHEPPKGKLWKFRSDVAPTSAPTLSFGGAPPNEMETLSRTLDGEMCSVVPTTPSCCSALSPSLARLGRLKQGALRG